MIIFRLLALALWVCAALALAMDIWIMTDTGVFAPKALAEWWQTFHSQSLTLMQSVIERYVWSPLWNPGVVTVISWPAFAVLAGFAFLLSIMSRKKPRRVYGDD